MPIVPGVIGGPPPVASDGVLVRLGYFLFSVKPDPSIVSVGPMRFYDTPPRSPEGQTFGTGTFGSGSFGIVDTQKPLYSFDGGPLGADGTYPFTGLVKQGVYYTVVTVVHYDGTVEYVVGDPFAFPSVEVGQQANSLAPGAQEICDIIPRRGTDGDGFARGTFTDQTIPTEAQALRVGRRFASRVAAAVPELAVLDSAVLKERAREVAALGSAAQIELTFYPESAGEIASQLQTQYLADLASLIAQVATALAKVRGAVTAASGGAFTVRPGVGLPSVPQNLTVNPYLVPGAYERRTEW